MDFKDDKQDPLGKWHTKITHIITHDNDYIHHYAAVQEHVAWCVSSMFQGQVRNTKLASGENICLVLKWWKNCSCN